MENVDEQKQPNLILAILLSFVMGLVGSVLFIVLYCVGFIAWIAGIVIVVAAGWGYKKFNLKMDTKGYIIVSIISIIDIIIALLLGIAVALTIELGVPFSQSLALFLEVAAEDASVKSALIYDIVLSLVCIGLGIGVFIGSERRKAKMEKNKMEAEERLKNVMSDGTETNLESEHSNLVEDEKNVISEEEIEELDEIEEVEEDEETDKN